MKQLLPFTIHVYGAMHMLLRCARRSRQLVGLLLVVLLLSSRAQAAVIITVGSTGMYPTIAQALANVSSPLTDAYELHLLDPSYAVDVLLTKTGTATNTLTIKPAAGVSVSITGTVTFGVGSAYTTLSGNNGNVGRALTLQQPDHQFPAVVFNGDAFSNTVSGVIIQGSTSSSTSGVVVIGDGVSTGNDFNTLTQCLVGNVTGAPLPANIVYAANAGTGTNDNFTLTNNELFNFSRTGVQVAAGNGDRWTISNNSFYYNVTTVPTTAQTAIDFGPGSAADGATVSSNFIGGRAAGAMGGIWENSGTQTFRGIVMNCGSSSTLINEVIGNTVSNVSLTGTGSSAALTALSVDAGRSELSGNTVTSVSNTGTKGVNSLMSLATTILSTFTVSSGHLMVVAGGLTEVRGNLTNAGILNHTGGDMLITGDFINSGIFTQTLGDIDIKGNMVNSGRFSCPTGKVKLTGAGAQTVSGGLYFNLEVNGVGTKTLTGNATIYNGVRMQVGVLATSRYALTLDTQANLAETNDSYVLGRVEVTRTPVEGALQDFGGVGLEMLPAAGSTLPGITSVSRVTGTTPRSVGGQQGIQRYFDVVADVNAGLDLTLTLRYLDHELNGIGRSNLRFFKSTNGGTIWQYKGVSTAGVGSTVDTGYATLTGVDGFSRWTLGDFAAPLPVGLTTFRAEREGRNAVLTWATATEENNRGFGVEVSLDGKTFSQIAFVAVEGSGSSAQPRAYRFVDATEDKAGSRYYRLRQDDLRGTSQYYGPRTVTFEAAPITFAAYPTRFGSDLTVELSGPAATATLRLLDAMGREVWHQEVTPGTAPLHVQPACAAGLYVLTATVAGQVLRQRVVKD